MNSLKIYILLLVASCFTVSPVLGSQDKPPVPRSEFRSPVEKKQDADPESKQDNAKSAEQDKPSDEKPADEGDSKKESDQDSDNEDGEQEDNQPSGEKSKNDDKQSKDKQSKDDQSKDDQSGDEKTDSEKNDGEKNENEKSLAEKALDRIRGVRGTSSSERVGKFSKQAEGFLKIFEPVVASVNESTLTIVSGKRAIALGTVVDSNGLVLTKASELRGSLGCKLNDGTILEAKVIGIDPKTDLALLQIDAENLNVGRWSEDPTPVSGRWVATPKGSSDNKPTIGVVSVDVRRIPPSKPFIGIRMMDSGDKSGVRINQVITKSPADTADLLVNDVIVSIDGTEVQDILSFRNALGQYDVNDRITIGILRGEKKLNIRLTLAEQDKVSPDNKRSNLQNSMGSILSRRRKDFPMAFQHDSMLSSRTIGGPIVDLSGRIVGINIARDGRVSSLALPADLVREIVENLKTGKLAPEIVNKEAIEKINLELVEINAKYSHLPDKKAVLERKYNAEKARIDELKKSIAEIEKRLKVIGEKSANYKSELDSVSGQIINIEKSRENLEENLERLRTGSR